MSRNLKITYLFESTDLWGGTKVGFEQAEALSDIGHRITILSKSKAPAWYPLRLPVTTVQEFDSTTIPDSDIIIGTYWPTVKAAFESGRGIPVHLCQGYEGGNKELLHFKDAIDEVYAYKIPKLTVSAHLDNFLKERFQAETFYIGQMINRNIFYPLTNSGKKLRALRKLFRDVLKVFVVGPFEADVKNISTALKGILLARDKFKVPIRLIRASQFPLSQEEAAIMKPDEYHFHVSFFEMGRLYRAADILISVSKETEGFGLPVLEAMSCGVPSILSKISSYRGFAEPQDYALFVEPSDSESLAKAISGLFHDRLLRENLTQRGLLIAGKFTKEMVIQRLQNAFEEILDRGKAGRSQ